jgi:signal transduction histidine kinase
MFRKTLKKESGSNIKGGLMEEFLDDLFENCQKQNSSSKLLRFFVNDILDFSQIRANKLKKNMHDFNLSSAIDEIISIQKDQA